MCRWIILIGVIFIIIIIVIIIIIIIIILYKIHYGIELSTSHVVENDLAALSLWFMSYWQLFGKTVNILLLSDENMLYGLIRI